MATTSITRSSFSPLSNDELGMILSYLDPYSQNQTLFVSHRIMAIVVYDIYQPWKTVEFLQEACPNETIQQAITDLTGILPPKQGSNQPLHPIPFPENEIRKQLARIQRVFLSVLLTGFELPAEAIKKLQDQPRSLQRLVLLAKAPNEITPREQSQALVPTVRSLVATEDLDEAIQVTRAMRARSIREDMYSYILIPRLIELGFFTTAATLISELPLPARSSSLYSFVTRLLSLGNDQKAIEIANAMESQYHKTQALSEIVQYFIQKGDLKRAREIAMTIDPSESYHNERNERIYTQREALKKIISACAHAKNVQELQTTVEVLLGPISSFNVKLRCITEWKKVNPDTEIPSEWSLQ